jgi:hypothetical protein
MTEGIEDPMLRDVIGAIIRRYGTDGSLVILDGEMDTGRYVFEKIAGGVKIHLIPDFIQIEEDTTIWNRWITSSSFELTTTTNV